MISWYVIAEYCIITIFMANVSFHPKFYTIFKLTSGVYIIALFHFYTYRTENIFINCYMSYVNKCNVKLPLKFVLQDLYSLEYYYLTVWKVAVIACH